MKKLIGALFILALFTTQSFAVTGWEVLEPLSTRSVSDIDNYIQQNNAALDLMLAGYRQNAQLKYSSAAALSIGAGEVMVSNSDGSVRLMLRNTSAITTSWSVTTNGLDAGAEETATTYHVYAISNTVTDTTFTVLISKSSSAPTGGAYFKRLGSFYNDASGNITLIDNDDNPHDFGALTSKTINVTYQATADSFIMAYTTSGAGATYIRGYTDSAAAPTTLVQQFVQGGGYTPSINLFMVVKKGDYWKVTTDGAGGTVYLVEKQ